MLLTLGCKTMREGVVAAAVFLALGVGLILAAVKIIPAIWYLQQIIIFVGFLMLLFAPVILVSTFLLSVLPGAEKKLDNCEH
ncbi:MAG: hypothetical protein HQL46_09075 [Gammaproteobacteria bacterium]|nr:hypothetical protein [Gammaproteobacteria bacterium]